MPIWSCVCRAFLPRARRSAVRVPWCCPAAKAPTRRAPPREVPAHLLRLAVYVPRNEGELARLAGAPATREEPALADIDAQAARLLARGSRRVLVKLGARGARLITAEGVTQWPAIAVR